MLTDLGADLIAAVPRASGTRRRRGRDRQAAASPVHGVPRRDQFRPASPVNHNPAGPLVPGLIPLPRLAMIG